MSGNIYVCYLQLHGSSKAHCTCISTRYHNDVVNLTILFIDFRSRVSYLLYGYQGTLRILISMYVRGLLKNAVGPFERQK